VKLQKYLRSKLGITLIEMVVTLGIAGILMGIAIPSFISWLPTLRLSDAAQQVATDWRLARTKAISRGTKYRLTLVGGVPGATSYVIDKEDPDNPGTYIDESGPFELPEGITVSAVESVAYFDPRGTASTASTITLSNGTDTQDVQLNTAGLVSVP